MNPKQKTAELLLVCASKLLLFLPLISIWVPFVLELTFSSKNQHRVYPFVSFLAFPSDSGRCGGPHKMW
jgi:hypothetical protein